MDKQLQIMHITQCHICNLAPAMRVCNVCPFKAGLQYWLCECPEVDRIKHKSELFCLRCDSDCPEQFTVERWLNEPKRKKILQELGFYD